MKKNYTYQKGDIFRYSDSYYHELLQSVNTDDDTKSVKCRIYSDGKNMEMFVKLKWLLRFSYIKHE